MVAKLEVVGLTKSFGDLEVLRAIGLEVERGAFIAVVGPSAPCWRTP